MTTNRIARKHARICKWKVKLVKGPEADAYLNAALKDPRVPRKETLGLYTCRACGNEHIGHQPRWLTTDPVICEEVK